MTRGEKAKVRNQKKWVEHICERCAVKSEEDDAYYDGWIDALNWVLNYLRYDKTGD